MAGEQTGPLGVFMPAAGGVGHLENCPNCNSTTKIQSTSRAYWVECLSCGVAGPNDDFDGAKWNSMVRRMAKDQEERFQGLSEKLKRIICEAVREEVAKGGLIGGKA